MVSESIEEQLPYEDRSGFVRGFCPNVTSSGVMLRGERVVRPLTRVSFTVCLVTGEKMLSGNGIVRWGGLDGTDTPLMGIEFLYLDPESLLILDELLATRGHASLSLEPPPPPDDLQHGAGMHRHMTPPPVAPLVGAPRPTSPFIAPPTSSQPFPVQTLFSELPAPGGTLEIEAEIEEFGDVA